MFHSSGTANAGSNDIAMIIRSQVWTDG